MHYNEKVKYKCHVSGHRNESKLMVEINDVFNDN